MTKSTYFGRMFGLCLLMLGLLSRDARADAFTVFTDFSLSFLGNPFYDSPTNLSGATPIDTGASSITGGISFSGTTSSESFHGLAGGRAGLHGLGADAEMDQFSYSGTGGSPFGGIYASASLHDTITLANLPTGETGNVQFTFLVDGTMGCQNSFVWGCGPGGIIVPGPSASLQFSNTVTGGVGYTLNSGKSIWIYDVPLSANPSFDLGLSLVTEVFLPDLTTAPLRSLSGSGSSDFYHSLTFGGYQILDDSGHVVPGASLVSADGIDYTGGFVASVPEPSTLILLGGALTFVFARLRARTNQRRYPSSRATKNFLTRG